MLIRNIDGAVVGATMAAGSGTADTKDARNSRNFDPNAKIAEMLMCHALVLADGAVLR
ncbi:MAG: hypothetical protein AAGB34_04030 [Planctomycetota bacterium]